jgi:hypothetical protein
MNGLHSHWFASRQNSGVIVMLSKRVLLALAILPCATTGSMAQNRAHWRVPYGSVQSFRGYYGTPYGPGPDYGYGGGDQYGYGPGYSYGKQAPGPGSDVEFQR